MKPKVSKEEKQEMKKANQALSHLITMAKKKDAFISEEIIKPKN